MPERIVYDNAAGVGRKWFDGIRLTRLFQAFQAHYGFEYTFCNPYSGHEKGGVEARVGAVRRRLFVPVPGVWNLDSFNLRLPGRCLELGDKDHYRKGESQTGLFDEDRKALLSARQAVRRGHVDEDEGRQIRQHHRPGPPPVRGRTRTRRP